MNQRTKGIKSKERKRKWCMIVLVLFGEREQSLGSWFWNNLKLSW